jgi:peroxin-2
MDRIYGTSLAKLSAYASTYLCPTLQEFLIFLLPILQARQTFLTAPLKRALLVLQRGIRFFKTPQVAQDYAAMLPDSKQNGSDTMRRKIRQEKHGRLWRLPRETCAICYLRLRPTIDHQLGLPALEPPISTDSASVVEPHAVAELMHDTTKLNELDSSETEIHLPTRTKCEAGCTYCYYCIAQEISALAKQAPPSKAGKDQQQHARAPGWECLRCGSEVFACQRVVNDDIDTLLDTTD